MGKQVAARMIKKLVLPVIKDENFGFDFKKVLIFND